MGDGRAPAWAAWAVTPKFFLLALIPAGRRVLRSDRLIAKGGRDGFDGTGQLGGLLKEGGARTYKER
jgi:hypothetical protein